MKIVMIGAGRLATHLGKALLEAGHDFLQVYSRTMEKAASLASTLGGAPVVDLAKVRSDADVYVMAVKDSALPELIPQVCQSRAGAVFLHTAGSVPMNVFEGMALHYGVLYPLQTFSLEREVDLRQTPCFVEGNDKMARDVAERLANSVSQTVYPMDSERRKWLHLAAVFACNFSNHCYDIAAEILRKQGIPFSVMLPLIDETAAKVHELSPREAQTGPALRFDEGIIREQSLMLRDNPLLRDLYERLSLSVNQFSKKRKPLRGGTKE